MPVPAVAATSGSGGLQYVVSPSLPHQVQKKRQEARLNNTLNNTLNGTRSSGFATAQRKAGAGADTKAPPTSLANGYQAYPALPKLYGTVQPYAGTGDNNAGRQEAVEQQLLSTNDAALGDTLSRIGPSARRLLGVVEDSPVGSAGPVKASTRGHPPHGVSGRCAPEQRLASTAPLPSTTATLTRSTRPDFAGTATLGRHRMATTREVAKEAPAFASTLTRDPRQEPPLVVTLRDYLDRELRLSRDGALSVSGAEQLGPYREAFSALITAFPGYASLLSDIRSAYDNVIQCQAELLTEAYSRESNAALQQREVADGTQELKRQVHTLQQQLEEMRAELAERDTVAEVPASAAGAAHNAAGGTGLPRPRSANTATLQRLLDHAETRVQDLEKQSRSDMEKILVLISAVRDCDKRLHEYEVEVQRMAGQVSELDEFKRLTAEAQAELVQYQQKFQAFVPSNDFEMMKDYLTEELAAAQTTIRKLRRTAAVRGTQVDVMTRKLEQLQADQAQLMHDTNTSSLLTPRPDWTRIKSEVPDLAEYTKSVHTAPLAAAVATSEQMQDDDVQVLSAPGISGSKAQVEFLVQRVKSLEAALLAAQEEKKAVEDQWRQAEGEETVVPDTVAPGRPSTARLQFSQAQRSQSGAEMSASAATGQRVRVGTRPAYPIIGGGLSARVPLYARAVGTVERVVITQTVCTRLLYDFFTQVLEPTLDVGVDADSVSAGELFARFLETEIPRNEDLKGRFTSVSHLVLNLMEDSIKPALTSPPLDLLVRLLQGTVPPRVAVDSASVVKLAINDLQALAKEQQSKRLRRSAVAECLLPVLELKSSSELAELRSCLGSELTFDVSVLTALENRFMSTLFFQECGENLRFYTSLVDALTKASQTVGDFNTVERSLHLSSVAEAIFACEPLTPQVVLRELSENAVNKPAAGSGDDDADQDSAARGEVLKAPPEDVPIRLSELLHAVASAPLIRRTRQSTKEECSL